MSQLLEFTFDYYFQEMVLDIGFAKSIVLKFINNETNRGNEFKRLSADYINEYVFCISKSLISKTLRDLEEDKLIISKRNEIDKFDRVKQYNITEKCLTYFNVEVSFSCYEYNTILGPLYYDYNDYKNNIIYKGLSEIDYIKLLVKERKELIEKCLLEKSNTPF